MDNWRGPTSTYMTQGWDSASSLCQECYNISFARWSKRREDAAEETRGSANVTAQITRRYQPADTGMPWSAKIMLVIALIAFTAMMLGY